MAGLAVSQKKRKVRSDRSSRMGAAWAACSDRAAADVGAGADKADVLTAVAGSDELTGLTGVAAQPHNSAASGMRRRNMFGVSK